MTSQAAAKIQILVEHTRAMARLIKTPKQVLRSFWWNLAEFTVFDPETPINFRNIS
jgi:hypothetical protein